MAKRDRTGELLELLFDVKATGDRHKVVIERYLGGFRATAGSTSGKEGVSPTAALENLRRALLDDLNTRIAVAEERLTQRRAAVEQLRERKGVLRA